MNDQGCGSRSGALRKVEDLNHTGLGVLEHFDVTVDDLPAGQAFLFLGLSGAGKSTISTMLAGIGATKVSDELVITLRENEGWVAEVTPFIGSVGLPHGRRFPLGALNLLIQAPEHHRSPAPVRSALPQLLRHTVTFGRDVSVKAAVLDLVVELLEAVPCYELEFAKRPDVADAILLTC